MGLTVGDIVELVGPDRTVFIGRGKLFCQSAGDLHVIVRVGIGSGRNFDQLGAEKLQRVLLFTALRLGNDDDRLIAQRIGDQRQTNAGIARSTLHNGAARPQLTAPLGIADNVERGAILHRLTGIEEFRLAEDFTPRRFRGGFQTDERRVADSTERRGVNGHD